MLTGETTNRRSNATNAYDLLSDIAEYILEEPKRIYMGDWLIQNNSLIKSAFGVDGPACGTVGCIAGNAVVLTGRREDKEKTVWGQAEEILGGNDLYLKTRLGGLFLHTKVGAPYGTQQYAQIVTDRIKEFQQQHEADLRVVEVTHES